MKVKVRIMKDVLSKIMVTDAAPQAVIDIEGVIGVPERVQFAEPGRRVATYAEFAASLAAIRSVRSPEVVVNIRSTGGDVNDAFLIYDALTALDAKVTTRCYGYVASAATVIAQAASPGCREISPNAMYLIHCAESAAEGNARSLEAAGQLLDRTDRRIASIYASRGGRSVDEYEALMNENGGRGRWLTPVEALEAGLVDTVMEHGVRNSADRPGDGAAVAAELCRMFGITPPPVGEDSPVCAGECNADSGLDMDVETGVSRRTFGRLFGTAADMLAKLVRACTVGRRDVKSGVGGAESRPRSVRDSETADLKSTDDVPVGGCGVCSVTGNDTQEKSDGKTDSCGTEKGAFVGSHSGTPRASVSEELVSGSGRIDVDSAVSGSAGLSEPSMSICPESDRGMSAGRVGVTGCIRESSSPSCFAGGVSVAEAASGRAVAAMIAAQAAALPTAVGEVEDPAVGEYVPTANETAYEQDAMNMRCR